MLGSLSPEAGECFTDLNPFDLHHYQQQKQNKTRVKRGITFHKDSGLGHYILTQPESHATVFSLPINRLLPKEIQIANTIQSLESALVKKFFFFLKDKEKEKSRHYNWEFNFPPTIQAIWTGETFQINVNMVRIVRAFKADTWYQTMG